MRSARRIAIKALIASFSVYLLPIATAHIVLVWGWAIGVEVFTSESNRQGLWLAADVALAITLQSAAFVIFAWIFAGRAWRWLSLLAAVPILVTILNLTYFLVIPTYFLIEPETAQEIGDWPVVCSVDDATLLQVRTPVTLDLTRAQEAWIGSTTSPRSWRLLEGTACEVKETAHQRPSERGNLLAVAAGGAALYTSFEGQPQVSHYWHLDPLNGVAMELTPPPDLRHWGLTLSRDGKAVGWIENRRNGQKWDIWLTTREIASGREREVLFQGLDLGKPEILALDGFAGEVIVFLYPGRVLAFDAEGRPSREPINTGEIKHVGQHFALLEEGWVAWEIYRDEGRHRLVWDLPSGPGRRELPLGSSISEVAVSPDGGLIAISSSTSLNIGTVRDSVFVFRTRDNEEVYRRFYRRHTRTSLTFLGAQHLALTRVDLDQGSGWVEVLEVPNFAPGE